MKTNLTDLLDHSLTYHKGSPNGVPLPAELAAELNALLETADLLQTAVPVSLPAAVERAADRNAFLAQAAEITSTPDIKSAGAILAPPVSIALLGRLKGWLAQSRPAITSVFSQKEPKPMTQLLLKAVLTVTLLCGSLGGTAALAANSLPDSPLYPLKLRLETARLSLADETAAQAELHLAFAAERTQEMADLALGGEQPDIVTLERMSNHLQLALQLAAQEDDDSLHQLLLQIQQMAQTQEGALLGAGPENRSMQQARQMWRQAGADAAAGLQEPQTFRWLHGNMPENNPVEFGPCNGGDCDTPGNQFGNDHQNGPDDGDCDNPKGCEPAGAQTQYGHDDEDNGRYGPGDGACKTPGECLPEGDENKFRHGQDEEDPGQYAPGTGDCETPAECEPEGDENHFGQDDDHIGQNGPGDRVCENPAGCEPAGDENHFGQDGDDHTGQNGPDDGVCQNDDCEPGSGGNNHGNPNPNDTGNDDSGGNGGGGN